MLSFYFSIKVDAENVALQTLAVLSCTPPEKATSIVSLFRGKGEGSKRQGGSFHRNL